MAIFPQIKVDDCVQECDCVRIDLSKTVVSVPDDESTVDIVEISPDGGATYLTIKASGSQTPYQKEWFLDWCYDTKPLPDGNVDIIARITSTDTTVYTKQASLTVKTAEEDCLFTDDNDLVDEEHDILEWLPEGRSSFLYVHRRAKSRILSWLAEQGHKDCYGNKLTIEDMLDKEEFIEWSRFLALRLIFGFISNARGDVYIDKYKEYCKKESQARNRVFTFDLNANGEDDGKSDERQIGTGLMRRG